MSTPIPMATESFNQQPLQSLATHLPTGCWQGQYVAQANGEPLMADHLLPEKTQRYMSENKRWEIISGGFVATVGAGGTVLSTVSAIGLQLTNLWPLSAEGLNLAVATVPSVICGVNISTLLSFSLYAGIGLGSLGVSALGCLGAAYLYTELYGEKAECGKQLNQVQKEHDLWKKRVELCDRKREGVWEAVKGCIPWLRNRDHESAFHELERRYQQHLDGIDRYNGRDPKKVRAMVNAAAPLERMYRRDHGLTSYESSPEYLDRRLEILNPQEDGTIGSRLLERKRSALPCRILRSGVSSVCRRKLQSVYSQLITRNQAKWRQDSYEYKARKQALQACMSIEEKRAQLLENEERSRQHRQFLTREYNRL
ncbi:hypothetical protein [Sansalvadorimonas verongulae]|uniref:hypothetical protein n=1 Tax=Sansalvadorimonas verongulae TaxID=2172824 RepID=UPI0012BB9C12|nr:hypothetical protein [Sansalvadorimonas verongulae]MTI14169.1 hypothetical protein [Sansalvadorimonas verongulae]